MAAKKQKQPEAAGNQKKVESKFSKEQLLAAERFRDRRDLLNALLSERETYTVKTVEQMIDGFMKGEVK